MIVKILSLIGPNSSVTPRQINAVSPNTNATLSLTAVPGIRHVAHNIQWSYSGQPTGGGITIQDGAGTICDLDIIAGGPGALSAIFQGSVSNSLTITLKAGGGGITGKLSAQTTDEVI